MAKATVEHESSVEAQVNAEGMVQLYNAQRTILVPESDAESFISEGWVRDYIDPVKAAGELRVLSDAMVTAFEDLIDEAEAKGELDPERALAVAQAAFTTLAETAGLVLRSIQMQYPVAQGDGVKLTRDTEDGSEEITVDPGQVGDYAELGWGRPKGRK